MRSIFGAFVFFILLTSSASTASAAVNLVQNPTFEILGSNGDPVGWFRGGYGQNSRTHRVMPCKFYTEADLLNTDPNNPNYVFRPECPPNAKFRLATTIWDYVNGDAKWYFTDVAIGANKDFVVSFDYQPYSWRARAILRYTIADGNYRYELLSELPQLPSRWSGNGYVGWSKVEREFKAPPGASSLTIFFAVEGNGVCSPSCLGPDNGTLSIANVVLKNKETLPPTAVTNLISNSSFETDGGNGDPAGWQRGGWGTNTRIFTYPTVGADGKKAAKVQITSYTNGDAKWHFNNVPVTGGKTYTFSDSYKSNIPSEIGVYYQTPTGPKYQYLTWLPATANWANVSRNITTPTNATAVTIFHSIYGVGSLETDNYSLTQVN